MINYSKVIFPLSAFYQTQRRFESETWWLNDDWLCGPWCLFPTLKCLEDCKLIPSLCVFVPLLQDGMASRGAEGGEVDPRTPRKSSSSRSSRKSFRLDYRLEVKSQNLLSPKTSFSTWNTNIPALPLSPQPASNLFISINSLHQHGTSPVIYFLYFMCCFYL